MRKRKFCFIFGTRPEIIKLSPLIKEFVKRKIPFLSIHTGQHFSYDMDAVFFKELGLPKPAYKLNVNAAGVIGHGVQLGRMLINIEQILLQNKPECIIVQGDTNSVLAGALSAEKIVLSGGGGISIAHVEAGLRSYDRSMPEEINRFVTDHCSDFLFAPTKIEKDILVKEGVLNKSIYVTGNTIVDALKDMSFIADKKSGCMKRLGLSKIPFMLLTMHRQENVDSKIKLGKILHGLECVISFFAMPIVFPIHPRTEKMIKVFNLKLPRGLIAIPPTGYLDFIQLLLHAQLVFTDSGGVQEEACILSIPCVTLRENTERPQTIQVGANMLAGTCSETIQKAAIRMFSCKRGWKNPFGDGKASARMADILTHKT